MGRICPILNHPLNDGVLIEDEALVSFIQKRNVDFLPHELVCRSCKREVTKLYKKKLKKAVELHRSRYMDGSISTLKTSKDSSSSRSSTTSEHSISRKELQQSQRVSAEHIMQNGKDSSVSETSASRQENASKAHANVNNNISKIISENQQNLANSQNFAPANNHSVDDVMHKNVTIRKRTIKDFLTPKPKDIPGNAKALQQIVIHGAADMQLDNTNANGTIILLPQESTTSKTTAASNLNASILNLYSEVTEQRTPKSIIRTASSTVKKKILGNHVTYDDEVDVIRRLSQEPSTSKAAAAAAAGAAKNTNSNKRPISRLIDSDDDDDANDQSLSLNAFNGTRLPHIQPLPPKRKSLRDKPGPIARDIMDDYIKDITGG